MATIVKLTCAYCGKGFKKALGRVSRGNRHFCCMDHTRRGQTGPRPPDGHKRCSTCKGVLPFTSFWRNRSRHDGLHSSCRSCGHIAHRRQTLGQYGMTISDYDTRLRSQRGRCHLCGDSPKTGGGPLVVDHDHKTGRVRGLLCDKCNLLLGKVEATWGKAQLGRNLRKVLMAYL